jgi:hypothetical protein
MIRLHHEPHFTFRFDNPRVIPRFHLEGLEAGSRVSVYGMNPYSGERLGQITEAVVGEGGWVDLATPIILQAGEAFIVVPVG